MEKCGVLLSSVYISSVCSSIFALDDRLSTRYTRLHRVTSQKRSFSQSLSLAHHTNSIFEVPTYLLMLYLTTLSERQTTSHPMARTIMNTE
jgi:hypothetical protein